MLIHWVFDLNYKVQRLAFEANGCRIWVMHQDLEIGVPSYVIKDVFVVVKSLVKNQCKGNKTFPFCLSLLSFLFKYLSYLFPRYVTP
jgi:hypothetical protein